MRVLCEAPKDRTSCDLASWADRVVERGERLVEIEEFHVDHHTRRGVALGRGPEFWLEQGGGVLKDEVAGLDSTWGDYVRADTRAQAAQGAN